MTLKDTSSAREATTLSRSIDARLRRLEGLAGCAEPGTELDRFLESLSDDDLTRLLHQLCTVIIEHPDSPPEEIEDAKSDCAKLEAEVLERARAYQQPDIAATVAANRPNGPMPWDRDWLGLAQDFGLIVMQGSSRRTSEIAEAMRSIDARLSRAEQLEFQAR